MEFIAIDKKRKNVKSSNLDFGLLFFEFMELNLEKYESIILVFFQVGISDASKYSTGKK